MKRKEALKLIKQHLKKENLIKHSLAVEACMIETARYFKEDEEQWGLAGLLHDLDYEYTVNTPEKHGLKTTELLSPYNLDPGIIHAIQAHNRIVDLDSRMDISLYAADPTTGFITACALIHPSKKLESIHLKRMKKRFKEKRFAEGACRQQMLACKEMNIELEEYLTLCLKAMLQISEHLGL